MEADDGVARARLLEEFKYSLRQSSLGFSFLVLGTNDLIHMEFTDKSLSQVKPPSKTAIYCHLTILTPGIYSKQVIIIIITITPKYPIWLTYISNRVELKVILGYIYLELAWAI